MKNRPTITFISDAEYLLKSKEIVSEFVDFMNSNGYEHYYPFGEDWSAQEIEEQIVQDVEKFQLQEASKKFQDAWDVLQDTDQSSDSSYTKNFTCVLTVYGPRGYFYTPDTVYVNIGYDTAREWVQTMLHEILHLVHFDETQEMTHAKREGFIDEKFIEFWRDVFPEYSKQKIGV